MKKEEIKVDKRRFLISPSPPYKPFYVVAVKAKNALEAAIMMIDFKNTGYPENFETDVFAMLVWEYEILDVIGKRLFDSSFADGFGRKIPDDIDINKIVKKGKQPFLISVSFSYELSDDGLKITVFAE